MTEKYVLALGTFDGLHPGHLAVLGACRDLAKDLGAASMVYTFRENPRSLFAAAPAELLPWEEKSERLKALGIDRVECVHFTRELSALSPEEFVNLLEKAYSPAAFVCGMDFTFGYKGEGTAETLRSLSEPRGILVKIVPMVRVKTRQGYSEEKISSTLIRKALENGDAETARKLMKGEPI